MLTQFVLDLVDAIATDLNAEDFDLSFTGIGSLPSFAASSTATPALFTLFSISVTVHPQGTMRL